MYCEELLGKIDQMTSSVFVHFVAQILENKISLQTEILLEAANFRTRRGWFETDIAKGTAACKSEFDFWTIAAQFEGAKNVAPLAQKLLS
jgi:hypothetical protein